jgi:hypothetical protein
VDVCCASGTGRIGANKTEKKKKACLHGDYTLIETKK